MGLRQMTFLSTMELLYSNGINLAKSMRVAAKTFPSRFITTRPTQGR